MIRRVDRDGQYGRQTIAAVRGRIGEMAGELPRELRAWETDLVYDAYAFDPGTGN